MIRAGQYLSRETMIERLVDAYHTGLWQKDTDTAEEMVIRREVRLRSMDEQEIKELYLDEFERGV